MTTTVRTCALLSLLFEMACSGGSPGNDPETPPNASPPDEAAIGGSQHGGDCFGQPRVAGQPCPVIVLSDELDTPRGLAVHDGLVYVATEGGLVRLNGKSFERVVEGTAYDGVSAVAIEGKWIVWKAGPDLWRAPIDDVHAAVQVASGLRIGEPLQLRGGYLYFGTTETSDHGALLRVNLDSPDDVEVVTTSAETGYPVMAIDEAYVYYVAASFSPGELRRVAVTGGEGERLLTTDVMGHCLAVGPELAFFTSNMGLYATRKSGGASARVVFDREPVQQVTADADGVYFSTSSEDEVQRVYRSSLDGTTVSLLGQWYGKGYPRDIAVDGVAVYVTDYVAGKLLKLPKQ